jgi:hypothetical protein
MPASIRLAHPCCCADRTAGALSRSSFLLVGGAVLLHRGGEALLVGVDELLLVAGLHGEIDPGQVGGLGAVRVGDGHRDLRLVLASGHRRPAHDDFPPGPAPKRFRSAAGRLPGFVFDAGVSMPSELSAEPTGCRKP